MHDDQRSEDDEDTGISEDQRAKSVLNVLLCGPSWPWTVDEIARELQAPLDAVDAIAGLCEAGLVHRFGEFVIPTRAARRADELGAGTI
jgi:hypothetical protein